MSVPPGEHSSRQILILTIPHIQDDVRQAVATALVGMRLGLVGVAALPTNATEVAARSIDPVGTHTGQTDLLRDRFRHNRDDEWVAAISYDLYDNYPGYAGRDPNNNPVCGRTADITYGGKTIRVGIVDRCEGCALWGVDLSPSAFQQFAPLVTGRLYGATWHFN